MKRANAYFKIRTNFREERITARNITTHFREERIIVRKYATLFREERIIVRKITRIETIGITKLQRKIDEMSCQTKLLRKATKSQEFCRKSLSLLLHSTVHILKKEKNYSFIPTSLFHDRSLIRGFYKYIYIFFNFPHKPNKVKP